MWWGDRHIFRLIYILHPPHHSCIWPCGGLSSPSKCSSHYQFDKSNIYRKISRQNLYFQKTRFLYHLQLIVSYHICLRPAEPTLGLLSPSLTLVLHRRSSTVFSGLMGLTLLCMRAECRDEGASTSASDQPRHHPNIDRQVVWWWAMSLVFRGKGEEAASQNWLWWGRQRGVAASEKRSKPLGREMLAAKGCSHGPALASCLGWLAAFPLIQN